MSAQLDVFGDEHPLEPSLTERQQFALDTLRQLRSGTADEIGAALHARRGRHPDDQRCAYCGSEGLSVLRALKKKGYVRQRRGGVFEPLEEGGGLASPSAESPSSSSGLGVPPRLRGTSPRSEPGAEPDPLASAGAAPVPLPPYDPLTAEIPW